MKTQRTLAIMLVTLIVLLLTTPIPPDAAAETQLPPDILHVSVPPVAPLASASQITIGRGHTCALTSSGGVKCWGWNYAGQLGDGTTINRSTPTDVIGLNSGVRMIMAAGDHTCAILTNGSIKCWGDNNFGQLGDGTTTNRLMPVDVSVLASEVSAFVTGGIHTCVLMATGGVKCWGNNTSGQLGDGTTINRLMPVDVSGLTSGVNALSAGGRYTCVVTNSGGVKCWGYNAYGQIGDGSTTNRLIPVDVSGLTNGVSTIVADGFSTCALTASGGVKCWGNNQYGQLGDGTTINRSTPVNVTVLPSGVKMIAPGDFHTCALLTSGGVKCWGYNGAGQLGDGTTSNRLTSVDVSGLTSGVSTIGLGTFYTCALTLSGGVKCWGDNQYGQLGDGTTTQRLTPVDVVGFGGTARFIDLTISLYTTPTTSERIPYENILGYFADAVYEMSNGTQKVNHVTIY